MAILEQHLHIVRAFSLSHSVPSVVGQGGQELERVTTWIADSNSVFHACKVMLSKEKGEEKILGEVSIAQKMARHHSALASLGFFSSLFLHVLSCVYLDPKIFLIFALPVLPSVRLRGKGGK